MSPPRAIEDRKSGRAMPQPPATALGGLATARPRQPVERNSLGQSAWEKLLQALLRALSAPAV